MYQNAPSRAKHYGQWVCEGKGDLKRMLELEAECSVANNVLQVLKNKLEASTQEVQHLWDKNEELLRLQSDAQAERKQEKRRKTMSSLAADPLPSTPTPHPIAQCVRQETPKQDCSTSPEPESLFKSSSVEETSGSPTILSIRTIWRAKEALAMDGRTSFTAEVLSRLQRTKPESKPYWQHVLDVFPSTKDVLSILSHNETPVILPSMIMESDVDMHSKKHGLLGARRQRRREHDWVTAEYNVMIEYVDKCVQESNLYKDE